MKRLLFATVLPALVLAQSDERWQRYSDLKFGMFIHWGPYSQASVEASWPIMGQPRWGISEADYRALAKTFNPVRYDPKAWVQLAKAAGQRYMVFTSKHHDGFCMFDSAYTSYKITNTPYKKDTLAMLAEAARAEKMPLGFYYSPPDMHHSGYRDTSRPSAANWRGEPERAEWAVYLDYMEMHVRELLTRYGDVLVVWFDGLIPVGNHKYDPYRFFKMIREMQPKALINSRLGLAGDFSTPEQRVPKGIPTRSATLGNTRAADDAGVAAAAPAPGDFLPWETCMTINRTWGYNKNDTAYKSVTELIRTLIDVASKGGNFLLNVGPTPEGTIQPEFEERLLAMGEWLKVNGEAIYGTTYGPVQGLSFGRSTARGKTVYLHVFDWPRERLDVSGIDGKVAKVTLLAGKKPLSFRQTGGRVSIEAPPQAPDPHATVLAVEMR